MDEFFFLGGVGGEEELNYGKVSRVQNKYIYAHRILEFSKQ